ncbi:MAG: class I SAM-dependent methyltransferase [Nanoarchaeota archaeon]|nr:class I SAM-dependent methyltransferase [Nanoarchaeota archaeon]
MSQKKVWDKIAESWYGFRHWPTKGVKKLVWKKGKILDVGCGNCRNLLPFKEMECYGVDFSDGVLEQAKKYIKKHNLNVNLKKADMTKLPFKDKSFDYILSLATLHHLKNPENGIKEIYRVLKIGGQAYITIWSKMQLRFLFKKRETYVKWGKENRYYNFIGFLRLRKMLKSCNFKILRSRMLGKNLEFIVESRPQSK